MSFEAQLIIQAKSQYDQLLARQYARLNKFAEKLADAKDEATKARGQAVIDLQFEEISKFKDWADMANDLILTLIQENEEEKNRAFSRGFSAGEKSKQNTSGFKITGSYKEFKNHQREQQLSKWADHH